MFVFSYRGFALLISVLCIPALLFGWQTESFAEAEDLIVYTKHILDATPR